LSRLVFCPCLLKQKLPGLIGPFAGFALPDLVLAAAPKAQAAAQKAQAARKILKKRRVRGLSQTFPGPVGASNQSASAPEACTYLTRRNDQWLVSPGEPPALRDTVHPVFAFRVVPQSHGHFLHRLPPEVPGAVGWAQSFLRRPGVGLMELRYRDHAKCVETSRRSHAPQVAPV